MSTPINIKTTEANKVVVSELTRRVLQSGHENTIARIALSYSISLGTKFSTADFNSKDSRGKEYKEDTLFGRLKNFYVGLICQHYNLHKTDPDLGRYFKLHLDDGLERLNIIFTENKSYTGLDFLIQTIERGIEGLQDVNKGMVNNFYQNLNKGFFEGPISIHFGNTIDTKTPIIAEINNKGKRDNAHIAVAGNSGTGKTQFALDLLRQFYEESQGNVNFLYLDFKGLKKEDVREMQPFFDKTKTTFIDAPQKPFPFNPLTFIDKVNEKNRLMGISKFVDIIATYAPKMGATQIQTLKDATKAAFEGSKGGDYPSFQDIAQCLFELTGGKADTLTQIIKSLSEYELFETKPKESFLNQNYYFSLSGDLDKTIRFSATFLTIYYIYNTFMNMENAPVHGDYQSLRYVLLIDEAHVIFKDKKSQDLLESILREIRSKGVVVVLLSQGIEEFNQPNFDFSSMCENAILLNIKDKTNLKIMNRFLGFSDTESYLLAKSMGNIEKGQAVTNLKEFKKGELFEVSQFWKS